MSTDTDFASYCRSCPDSLLRGVLEKEWEAWVSAPMSHHQDDYETAKIEARSRGWFVVKGQVR